MSTSLPPDRVKEAVMPTATDRDFLDMRVGDVRRVVLLQESSSSRRLPIWIGHEHALELALRLLDELAEETQRQDPPEPPGS